MFSFCIGTLSPIIFLGRKDGNVFSNPGSESRIPAEFYPLPFPFSLLINILFSFPP